MKYIDNYTKEISFPIGAIGSGSIGLAGNGRLVDWEIFNRPSKGSINGYSHFAIKAIKNNKPIAFVLNGDLKNDLTGRYGQNYGLGPKSETMCGFTHFKNVCFNGEFPIAKVNFKDAAFPADVKLTAFNPFIPCDEDNSSISAAFFEIEIHNTENEEIEYQAALSVANPFEKSANAVEEKNGYKILKLYNAGADKSDIGYGDLSVATNCPEAYTQTYWYRRGWQDSVVTFWNDFHKNDVLKERKYDDFGSFDTGSVATKIKIKANQTKKVRFVLLWNVPNNYNYWSEYKDKNGRDVQWKNYYARSMASYALIPILGGFEFDLPNKYIGFNPYIKENFRSIWSVDGAWGEILIYKDEIVLSVAEGKLKLSSFGAKFSKNVFGVSINKKSVDYKFKDGIIYFNECEIYNSMEIKI